MISNGIILAPVSVSDVQSVLGVSSNDVGALCTSARVNMWSWWKPLRWAGLTGLTSSVVQELNSGIAKRSMSFAITVDGKYSSYAPTGYSLGWIYNRPQGGAASPYRLGDFRNYNHRQKSPDGNYIDSLTLPSNLEDIAGYDMRNKFTNVGSGGAWVPSGTTLADAFGGYASLRFLDLRYGESPYEKIGDVTDRISMNLVAKYGTNGSERLRLGLIVNFSGTYYLLTGVKCLGQTTNADELLPSLFSNTVLCYNIFTAPASNKDFVAYPCIVKNAQINIFNASGSKYRTYISCSDVYTMPSTSAQTVTLSKNVDPDDPRGWVWPGGYTLLAYSKQYGCVLFQDEDIAGDQTHTQFIRHFYYAWTGSGISGSVQMSMRCTGSAGTGYDGAIPGIGTISPTSASAFDIDVMGKGTVRICQFYGMNTTSIGTITQIAAGGNVLTSNRTSIYP